MPPRSALDRSCPGSDYTKPISVKNRISVKEASGEGDDCNKISILEFVTTVTLHTEMLASLFVLIVISLIRRRHIVSIFFSHRLRLPRPSVCKLRQLRLRQSLRRPTLALSPDVSRSKNNASRCSIPKLPTMVSFSPTCSAIMTY